MVMNKINGKVCRKAFYLCQVSCILARLAKDFNIHLLTIFIVIPPARIGSDNNIVFHKDISTFLSEIYAYIIILSSSYKWSRHKKGYKKQIISNRYAIW